MLDVRHAELTRLIMDSTLVFGTAIPDAVDEWSKAYNLIRNRKSAEPSIEPQATGPDPAFTWVLASHLKVIQAMRGGLHLEALDTKLLEKLV